MSTRQWFAEFERDEARRQDRLDQIRAHTDWYARRDELESGQIYLLHGGERIKLDRRVPGDGTQWFVADWCIDHWSNEDSRIEPGDLKNRIE